MEVLVEVAFWVTRLASLVLALMAVAAGAAYFVVRRAVGVSGVDLLPLPLHAFFAGVGSAFWFFISHVLNGFR